MRMTGHSKGDMMTRAETRTTKARELRSHRTAGSIALTNSPTRSKTTVIRLTLTAEHSHSISSYNHESTPSTHRIDFNTTNTVTTSTYPRIRTWITRTKARRP